ncbi:MAG: PAS domain S-box protein [Deltaproteobacteria bacterium]|nr:PAS domain S-box protein [Deltaproteobacteria bacterium]
MNGLKAPPPMGERVGVRERKYMSREIRILIAEENPDFVRMVEDSLRESGGLYRLGVVSSGKACLKKLQDEKFDILLLDHSLPDGSGLTWLRRFNEMGIGIPTIFVTAKGDPQMSVQAMEEGVFDYINRSAECAKAFPFVVNRAIEGYSLMVEKVRLQKELIETKNFLESIVERAGDAISVVDLEGKILYWNEGAEQIYGYRKEEVLGKRLSDFLFPADENFREEEERLLDELMMRVKQGGAVPNVEVKRRTKEGKEIITSMTLSPLRDAEGRVIGASRICKDITQLKKVEERLLLTERLTSLGELTAGVAHELRNPLAGIKINTQVLLRKKDLPEMERKLLDSSLEGIGRIQKIVDDMLHFAKPKAAHFKEEEINEVAERSLAIFQTKLKRGNISLLFQKGEGLPKVWIDAHQIQQVLTNLMLNAIQAMEKGGTLALQTFSDGKNEVGIEVKDTGAGIPKSHLKKIFDPFFTTKSEGTGLGLSISIKILESHGATIDVTSQEGKGSTFIIHFPIRGDHAV